MGVPIQRKTIKHGIVCCRVLVGVLRIRIRLQTLETNVWTNYDDVNDVVISDDVAFELETM